MLAPNTLLQNRYLVAGVIGQGGMGAVYLATDQRLRCTVALKETFFTEESLRRAFEREAHLLASLRHPALPNVTDHFTEDDGQYLVMQFIPGDDLEDMVGREGRLPAPHRVLSWADQLLDVLDYLHTQQRPIIHRDIKPKNLKLAGRDQVILLDFGLAKGATGQMQSSAANKSVLGYTPGYSPLEQVVRADQRWIDVLTITNSSQLERAQEQGTDARSDLYALGATIYRLLTGAMPKDAPTRALWVWSGRPDPLLQPHEVSPHVGPAVNALLLRALAIDREQRFASAEEMRRALRAAAGGGALFGAEGRAGRFEGSEEATVIDSGVSFECYGETDVGRVRSENADNFLLLHFPGGLACTASDHGHVPEPLRRPRPETKHLIIAVADGLDDQLGADVASRMAVEIIRDMLMPDEYGDAFDADTAPIELLCNAIDYANFAIHRRSQEDLRISGMGASLTAAVLSSDVLELAQVGDSRAYLIRDDEIRLITKDQTAVQHLLDIGQITEREAETHAGRGVLLQVLGGEPELTPVITRVKVQRGDVALLCSRGLWGKLPSSEIKRIIVASKGATFLACSKLIAEANARGGEGNITALLAAVKGGAYHPGSRIKLEYPSL